MTASCEHRDVPRVALEPHQLAGGWCGFCGRPTFLHGTTWHEECWRDYQLLRETRALMAIVAERDGLICAWCAKPGWISPRPANARASRQLHLDHCVPLWAVVGLPPPTRRAFYAPANLQLLCVEHHHAKTAVEARVRAEMKRRAKPVPEAVA